MQQKLERSTVIIYSSARKNGNTQAHVNGFAEQNAVRVICLDDYKIAPYCYSKNYKNDDFYAVFEALLTYDHWVFASPVYWYSTTVQMKLFIAVLMAQTQWLRYLCGRSRMHPIAVKKYV